MEELPTKDKTDCKRRSNTANLILHFECQDVPIVFTPGNVTYQTKVQSRSTFPTHWLAISAVPFYNCEYVAENVYKNEMLHVTTIHAASKSTSW